MSDIDLSGYETATSREPLPTGTYKVEVENAEVQRTKAGDGSYVNFTFRVIEGAHEGRKVFHNAMFQHPSNKAVEIGCGQLKAVLLAGNKEPKFSLNDLSVFLGIRMPIQVGIERDSVYGDKNRVVGFGSATAGAAAGATPFDNGGGDGLY